MHAKNAVKPILIINKSDGAEAEKECMKMINKTMIKQKVPISKSFKNKLGNTVFVCDSVENRNRLRDEIVKHIPTVSYKAPPPFRSVVAIVGFDNDCTVNDLNDALVNQNHTIKNFLELNNTSLSDHSIHLVTRTLKNNDDLSQALFKVSPALRQLLKKINDKVIVGSTCCKIYDRHNFKRCNRCYDFGHFAAQCKAEQPVCGYCAGPHQTNECSIKDSAGSQPVCNNCKNSDEHCNNTRHPAYSFSCPVYQSHLNLQ